MNIGMTISQSLQVNDLHISGLQSKTSYSFGSTSQPCTLSSGHQTRRSHKASWSEAMTLRESLHAEYPHKRGGNLSLQFFKTNSNVDVRWILVSSSVSNKYQTKSTEAMAYSRSRCWDSKWRPKITTSASITDSALEICCLTPTRHSAAFIKTSGQSNSVPELRC